MLPPAEPVEPLVPLDIVPLPLEVDDEVGALVPDRGDAAGFCPPACASRLHASKSAWMGAASALPDMLKIVAAAMSAHALLLRFMIGPPRWK